VNKVRFFTMMAAAALVAGAVGTAPARAQDKVIKIASQSPLSGPNSPLGIAISNGTRLAVEQLSEKITAAGITVEYVAFDDQATADIGTANAQTIVNDAAILAVVGHLNSGVAIPSSEIYNEAGLVMVSPANTNVRITDRAYPTVNRVCGRDDMQGSAGAQFAAETLGWKTVYILHDKTAYGEGVATFFRQAAEAAGIEVLGFEGTEEQSNFDAIITPIQAVNPDGVYFGGLFPQAAVFFQQARAKDLKAGFLGPDGMDSSDLARIGGEAVVGMNYTTTAGPASVFPGAAKFVTDYEARFNIKPEPYASEGYASTQIILAAIEKLVTENGGNVPTREEVAAAVRATADFETIIGTISFDANGDPKMATYYILEVGAADPAKWSENKIVASVVAPSPLTAMEMMEMTPEATMEMEMEMTATPSN
jgi:branched-chain amino acid transport system substrate-binding protein